MYGQRSKSKSLKRRVIVRKVRKVVPPQPRGAWKIAYADFVTALLAFFLLMWLTAAVSEKDLLAISDYFKTPMIVYLGGKSTDESSSLIPSEYGDDKTKETGQVKKGDKPIVLSEAEVHKILRQQEIERLRMLKSQLEQLISNDPKLSQFKNQLLVDMTTEGLRILIIDEQNRPMFELGSSVLQPYTVEILHAIGGLLNKVQNRIALSGHTDATPYVGTGENYTNWELSMDRANASRRALAEGGMNSDKVLRVVGLADSALFNPKNPFDANNRRISVIVLNQATEQAITQQLEP